MKKILTNNAIISDTLGRGADASIASPDGSWELSRWRQFVGDYTLPGLSDPAYVLHFGGKPEVRTRERSRWSERFSAPGSCTSVPAGVKTGWLVDGELDVVTLTFSRESLAGSAAAGRFEAMRFALPDTLSMALARQAVAELYAPPSPDRDAYIITLVDALRAHVLRGEQARDPRQIPANAFAAHRMHAVLDRIHRNPEHPHSVAELAALAGMSEAHFCRMFKHGTGMTPHNYVMKIRLERAQQLLEHSSLPIGVIADQLGFASQSHFTRAFRRHCGRSPSEHRGRGALH